MNYRVEKKEEKGEEMHKVSMPLQEVAATEEKLITQNTKYNPIYRNGAF